MEAKLSACWNLLTIMKLMTRLSLCQPTTEILATQSTRIEDLPPQLLKQIEHHFNHYKGFEKKPGSNGSQRDLAT